MNFWRRFFGFSQREIWHQVATDESARFVFGSALEGDRIEYSVRNNLVAVYVTTKGNSWYTVFESSIKATDILSDKSYINSLKKKEITVTSCKENETEYFFLQMKDEGINKDRVLLKERMNFFAQAIELLY